MRRRTAAPAAGPEHQAQRPQLLAVGVIIWLGSEFMFFSGLFAAFFTIRRSMPNGLAAPGNQARHLPGARLHLRPARLEPDDAVRRVGARAGRAYKKARIWIVASFLLGAAFLGNQTYEWKTLPFRPQHQRLRLALLHHVAACTACTCCSGSSR